MTHTIDIRDAEAEFATILSRVMAGDEIILTDQQKPVAKFTPVRNGVQRVAGLHAGNAWMSEDFDDPLPDELWLGGS